MEVIKLVIEDYDRCREDITFLFKEAVVVNFPNNIPDDAYYTENVNALKSYIEDDRAIVFLCRDKEKIIGMAWCHTIQRFNERRLHIASIAVKPECRNLGVGKMLINQIEEFAINNSYVGIDLLVTAENLGAVYFYQNKGFQTERLLMKKEIKNEN